MQHRPGGRGGLVAADLALEEGSRSQLVGFTMVAPRAAVAARPARLQEVASTFRVARETALKFEECLRKAGSPHVVGLRPMVPSHYMLGLGESNG